MVINALFIKPIDDSLIRKIVKDGYKILVIEENVISGGLASQIMLKINTHVDVIGIDDKYVTHGSVSTLLEEEKLCIKSLEKEVLKLLN